MPAIFRIRKDESGRYSLNDCHRASGGAIRHTPARWRLRNSSKHLIATLQQTAGLAPIVVAPSNGVATRKGSFGLKEVLLAYAHWIGPDFGRSVAAAIDSALPHPGPSPTPPELAEAAMPIPDEFADVAAICTATEIEIGGQKVLGIADARQLHQGLGVGRDFTTWVEGRIKKYGFQAGMDYEISQSPNRGTGSSAHTGGSPTSTYRLTLDMAKELAMVENNEMGRRIRRYFIWAENSLRETTAHADRHQPPVLSEAAALREKIIMALIATSAPSPHLGRSSGLIADADRIRAYVMSGEI